MPSPLRIAYLLEDTDLSGGVRVTLAQADALIARGHAVTLITKGPPLTWRGSTAEWLYVDDFASIDATAYDFVIGTFWTSVRAAHDIAAARAIHLCQGYEGSFSHYQGIKREIDAVYSLPVPKMVVSPQLVEICRQFVSDVVYVGQIVDDAFFRSRPPEKEPPLRLLLAGASQVDTKGVDVGYGAALHARWRGAEFELIRLSPWAPSREEPLEAVAEFHVAVTGHEAVRLVHSCDLFLGPNRREEGFGLPAAEAMASSIPTVLTRIPSYLSFADDHDYALFGEQDDPVELGEHIVDLLEDEELRNRIAMRGRRVAEQFRAPYVAERIERFLLERRKDPARS